MRTVERMNKPSAMAIARLVRAVADPSNYNRLDATAAELVASLEAGITCYAAVTQRSQIRFSPRERRLDDPVPRGARHGLRVAASFQFVDEFAPAALAFAIEATRISRAAMMAQAVIDIAAAGGTIPDDTDFAQLLEIDERAAMLTAVEEMSKLAHKIAMGADARRLADTTTNPTIRAKLLAKELTSAQIAAMASSIFELAVTVLATAGVPGASITSCRLPDDGEDPGSGRGATPCRQCGTPEGGQRSDLRADWRCSACGATGSGQ